MVKTARNRYGKVISLATLHHEPSHRKKATSDFRFPTADVRPLVDGTVLFHPI